MFDSAHCYATRSPLAVVRHLAQEQDEKAEEVLASGSCQDFNGRHVRGELCVLTLGQGGLASLLQPARTPLLDALLQSENYVPAACFDRLVCVCVRLQWVGGNGSMPAG